MRSGFTVDRGVKHSRGVLYIAVAAGVSPGSSILLRMAPPTHMDLRAGRQGWPRRRHMAVRTQPVVYT